MQCHATVLNCGLQATPSPTTLRLYPTKQGVVTSQKVLLFIWVFYFVFLIHRRLGSKVLFLGSEFSSQATRPVWGEVPGCTQYTQTLMPNRNAAAASHLTRFAFSPCRSRDGQPASYGYLRAAGLHCQRGTYLKALWHIFMPAELSYSYGNTLPKRREFNT